MKLILSLLFMLPLTVKAQDTIYVQNDYVVFFEKNKYTLEEGCMTKLDEIPEGVNACVTGFSSPEGDYDHNIELSQRRADEVTAYLRKRGVKINSSVGLGVQGAASNRVVIVSIF